MENTLKSPLNAENEVIDLCHEVDNLVSQENEDTHQKVKRYTFTMPIDDNKLIKRITQEALSFGININQSEVVRVGLQLLANLSGIELECALSDLDRLRRGRPKAV